MNYIDFKLQGATKLCVDALKSRGFQVKEDQGQIIFLQSSSAQDMYHATIILNKLDIPFIRKDQSSLEILVNQVPLSIFDKISKFGGRPYTIPYRECQTHWRYFHNHRFGIRLNALDLEYNMASFVKAANLAGIRTVSGCNGHYKKSPRFQVVGEYYGAWFEVVQKLFMADLDLNYQWKVLYQGVTKAEIRAIGDNWDMDRIHQDTVKMAEKLEQHADQIRLLKTESFRKKSIQPKQFVRERRFNKLVQWMLQQCEQNRTLISSEKQPSIENTIVKYYS